jgi:phosphoenolpyruvate-protein phosphotransferase
LDVPGAQDEPHRPTSAPAGPSGHHGRVLAGVPTSPGAGAGPVVRSPVPTGGGVVVAGDLGPAQVMALDPEVVQAVATAAGAPLSHAAILARSLGIPAVTGLGPEILEVPAGALVLVDGDAGTVQVDPPAEAVEAGRARQQAARRRQHEARELAATPAVTRDGHVVQVLANVGSPEEAGVAVGEGADGVGMLRTEFAFLGRSGPPNEQEQFLAYREVARAIGARPLIVRTLDLGADIPAWDAAPEPNPALGNRGLRLMLAAPELLETQLRAIARLAEEHPLWLKFPMVTTLDELHRALACLEAVTTAPVGSRAGIDVGITVEVPAAAVTADVFAPVVDFFSIGTNDLTQYTLATDRSNAAVAGLADGLQPAVLRLIRTVTSAAERHRRPVVVVGELASDRLAVPLLLGLGVISLSVRPNAVAAVKQIVREVTMDDARRAAEAALTAESAAVVRRLASQYWAKAAGPA